MFFSEKFNRKETKVCLIIWISVVLYAIYQFTIASQKYFEEYHDDFGDFTSGWSLLNFRKKDKADFEWETIGFFFKTVYPTMVCYLVISEASRYLVANVKLQQIFQTLFPLLYLAYSMGYKVASTALVQPILFHIVQGFQSNLLIWICNIGCLALIALYKQINTNEEFLKDLGINHFEAYLSILLLCWMNLKCTSFSLNVNATSGKSLLDYLTYCFYLPTLFTGPFITYEEFRKIYNINTGVGLAVRLIKLLLNVSRCVFWMVFVDFWLHFIYINATSFQLNFVKQFDLCSLCGYGYLMGQFFHIKYVILYGLSTSLASFEDVTVPSLPRCIGRVHLYSDMWKYFDPGLYNFLKTCIFLPTQKLGVHKFVSSFLCFFFVYIWHGIEEYIFVWAALNFAGVCLESLATTFYAKRRIYAKLGGQIGDYNLRRLKSALAAPLLGMSAVSNFYFFAGKEVGDVFVEKLLSEACFKQILLLLALYCCCEVSTELRDTNARRM